MRAQAKALGSLSRAGAPRDLDGRVVASIQAGYRQDRAVVALARLEPKEAPIELQRHVRRQLALFSAPDILRRLVEEEMAAPDKALAKRYAGRLDRVAAPDALSEAVENLVESASLDADADAGPGGRFADGPGAVFVLAAASTLALLVLAIVWALPGWDRGLNEVDQRETLARAGYSFEIVHDPSLDAVDPRSAALVDSMLDGLLTGVVR